MFSIGIDLGGTNIVAAVIDENANILSKVSLPTKNEREYPLIIADMAKATILACEKANLDVKDAKGIGIGSPGTINTATGTIIYANNLKFENVPMADELKKHIDLPIFISNDANCAALGETSKLGAAYQLDNVVLITLGTGVGGGVIIDGKIYEGHQGGGAELGHMTIMMDGRLCTCKRRGCWEAYASATGLKAQTKEALLANKDSIMWQLIDGDLENISGTTAFKAAKQGDSAGNEVVSNYIKYLAEGLIDLVNIFRPQVILIGGGVSNESEDSLYKPLREYIKKYTYGNDRVFIPDVIKAKLGNDAGLIGAAMLV